MFRRRTTASPTKGNRSLTITTVFSTQPSETVIAMGSLTPPTSSRSEESVGDYKFDSKPTQLSSVNTDSIKLLLEKTLLDLKVITDNTLEHFKPVVKKILEDTPITVIETFIRADDPPVELSIEIAGKSIVIDCEKLVSNSQKFLEESNVKSIDPNAKLIDHNQKRSPVWLDDENKIYAIRKLNHLATIFSYINNTNQPSAVKIAEIATYLEKSDTCRELRYVRTDRDNTGKKRLPGYTRGGQYIKSITPIIDNSMVAIENLCQPQNITAFQLHTIIRLEMLCLHYLNFLSDKTLELLTALSSKDLETLHHRFSPIKHEKSDNRFIVIDRVETENVKKEFKIYITVLLENINLFPANQHEHIKQSHAALELLAAIEEVNNTKPFSLKLKNFFTLFDASVLQNVIDTNKSPFWSTSEPELETFLINIKKIKGYYDEKCKYLVQTQAIELTSASNSPLRIHSSV